MSLTATHSFRTWRRRIGIATAVCLVLVMAAYVAGRRHPVVHTEEAGCLLAVGSISCELSDDWTIGVPRDVGWTSASGAAHEGGRPGCLPPTARGVEGPVRLSWIDAEVDGRSWRQVVWVTCLD